MTINLADIRFAGPYSRFDFLDHRPGVWAILDGRAEPPIAAGTAEDMRDALTDHPDREHWSEDCERPSVAVFYSPRESHRERVLEAIRAEYGLTPLAPAQSVDAVGRPEESAPPPVRAERPDRRKAGDSGQVRAVS